MNRVISYFMKLPIFEKKYYLFFLVHPFLKCLFFVFSPWYIKHFSYLLKTGENIKIFFMVYFFWYFFYFIYSRCYTYFFQVKFYSTLKKEISLSIVKNVLYNSKSYFSLFSAAEIVHLLIHLNENIIDLIKLIIDGIFPILVTFCGITLFLFCNHSIIGALFFLWLLVIFYLSYLLIKYLKEDMKLLSKHKTKLSEAVFDVLQNSDVVRAFFAEKNEINRLEKKIVDIQTQEILLGQFYYKISIKYFFSFILLNGIVSFIFFYYYSINLQHIEFFLMWITIAMMSYSFSENLLDYIMTIPRYYYGIEEALDVLTISDKKIRSENAVAGIDKRKLKIEFRDVSFWLDNKKIIDNVSFIIFPGEKIAWVGFSGSGKSTLLFLLLRMYIPSSGKILIDDQDIEFISDESLYELFTVVLQKNSLFNRSIKENILYPCILSDNDIVNEKMMHFLKMFDMERLVKESESYDSINESINQYSGGEQQRIIIIRALLKNAPILIFDEPTSNIDVLNEKKVIDEIFREAYDKTLIMVTHNLEILPRFDRILVFENGLLVQEGTHNVLIQQVGSLYEKLHYIGKVI